MGLGTEKFQNVHRYQNVQNTVLCAYQATYGVYSSGMESSARETFGSRIRMH